MERPGVMAPPDLYERPTLPGLMSAGSSPPHPVGLKAFLWALAVVLAAVELWLDLVT